jgi:hypothetical protein
MVMLHSLGITGASAGDRCRFLPIMCIGWFDLVNVLVVSVPDVELFARPPPLHIRSPVEPCRDFRESCIRIVRAAAKLYHHIQFVFLPASTAVASVCFDGFLDEGVKEFIETFFPISSDDELPSPFGEFAIMFLFAESRLHLFMFLDRTPASVGAVLFGDPSQPLIRASILFFISTFHLRPRRPPSGCMHLLALF